MSENLPEQMVCYDQLMPGRCPAISSEQILYGQLEARAVELPQMELLQPDAFTSLTPHAQNYLLVLAQLQFHAGGDISFPANMIAAGIEGEADRINRSALIMHHLEKKGLVQGLQGRDMPRVHWRLTDAGKDAQPLTMCECGQHQHLYLGRCMRCCLPLFGWSDQGLRES